MLPKCCAHCRSSPLLRAVRIRVLLTWTEAESEGVELNTGVGFGWGACGGMSMDARIRLSVTEPVVPGLRLLSSARLCAFPVVLPSFSSNSLFRPNKANISYLYILVYLSLYNNPVFASRSRFSFSLSLSARLKTPKGSERALPVLGTKLFPVSDPFRAPTEHRRIAPV